MSQPRRTGAIALCALMLLFLIYSLMFEDRLVERTQLRGEDDWTTLGEIEARPSDIGDVARSRSSTASPTVGSATAAKTEQPTSTPSPSANPSKLNLITKSPSAVQTKSPTSESTNRPTLITMLPTASMRTTSPTKPSGPVRTKSPLGGKWSNPYGNYIPKREKTQYISKPGLVERDGWDFNFGPKCNVSWAPYWKQCDDPECKAKPGPRHDIIANLSTVVLGMRHEKERRMDTVELIQQTMKRAWGSDYPQIDLYLRTGCRDVEFIRYLVESIRIFWPRFLGRIILVLDFNNREALEAFVPIPLRQEFDWLVVYEHTPCMSGRIFNQYAYLNLFRYTNAEYVVTFDSDCVFTTPMTPDRIFNEAGLIIVPVSVKFQTWINWNEMQAFFTNQSFVQHGGHSMVTQPVNFHVDSTFKPYLNFVPTVHSQNCYEERIVDLFQTIPNWKFYCWMCQLSVFASLKKLPRYEIRHLDSSKVPYQRVGLHVKYERLGHPYKYEGSIKLITRQALCRYVTSKYLPECISEGDEYNVTRSSYYLYYRTFVYDRALLSLNTTELERQSAFSRTRDMFVDVLEHVLAGED